MRTRHLAALLTLVVATFGAAACRQDMHNAPRVDPYEETDAFPDGRPSAYRIVDPAKYVLTMTFDL